MKSISVLATLAAVASAGYHHNVQQNPPAVVHTTVVVAAPAHVAQSTPAVGVHAGAVHTVIVGGTTGEVDPATGKPKPKLLFQPESIQAAVGDVVRFEFLQANHTVTQSTFAEPCNAKPGGADSGYKPNPEGTLPAPTFDFTVSDTEAVWMFCGQGPHCSKGMVFAINAATSGEKTFEAYKALAIASGGNAAAPPAAAPPAANAPLAGGQPPAAQSSTVTMIATTPGAVAPGETGAAVAAPSDGVAQGSGTTPDGQACSCSCLCGTNAFPADVGQGMFGGFLGQMPA